MSLQQLLSRIVLSERPDAQRGVLGFDFGCETSDGFILSIRDGTFEVESSDGDTNWSGKGFHSQMAIHYAEFCMQTQKCKDPTTFKKAISHLRRAREVAKRVLTSPEYTNIIEKSSREEIEFSKILTQSLFGQLCQIPFIRLWIQ